MSSLAVSVIVTVERNQLDPPMVPVTVTEVLGGVVSTVPTCMDLALSVLPALSME